MDRQYTLGKARTAAMAKLRVGSRLRVSTRLCRFYRMGFLRVLHYPSQSSEDAAVFGKRLPVSSAYV